MRFDQLIKGAQLAARIDARKRRERIATHLLAGILSGETLNEPRNAILQQHMVTYAVSLAEELVRQIDRTGGAK
jgi:hypothetical protein